MLHPRNPGRRRALRGTKTPARWKCDLSCHEQLALHTGTLQVRIAAKPTLTDESSHQNCKTEVLRNE